MASGKVENVSNESLGGQHNNGKGLIYGGGGFGKATYIYIYRLFKKNIEGNRRELGGINGN